MPDVEELAQSGSVAVSALSTRTRYQRGRAVPDGRYEMKKSFSELEAIAEAIAAGVGVEAGARDWLGTRAGRASMEVRDGKGVSSNESIRAVGWTVWAG